MLLLSKTMDTSHPLLADEINNVLIDKNMNPDDASPCPEELLKFIIESRCFQAECTWVWALVWAMLVF